MARLLLLADSNFTNNIGDFKGRKIKTLEVKSCQTRRTAMAEVSAVEEGIVVISCLDMIAADVVKTTPVDADRAIEVYYNQLLMKMVDKVDETDGKVAFGVMPPLFWTSLPLEARKAMSHTYKLMKLAPLHNVYFHDFLKDVKAGADGTHLISHSANRYIGYINGLFSQVSQSSGLAEFEWIEPEVVSQPAEQGASNWAEEVMDAQQTEVSVVSLGPPEEEPEVRSVSRSTTMLSASMIQPPIQQNVSHGLIDETQARLMRLAALPDLSVPPPDSNSFGKHFQVPGLAGLSTSLLKIERRVGNIEAQAFYNHLMMAMLKEEQDTEANRTMLNRVTFSGVVIEGLAKMDEPNKIKAMKDKIMAIIELLRESEQELALELLFVRHLNKQIRGQKSAVIEAKFADAKQTKELRTIFVKKQKSLPEKINVTPVVRLATRVRIEMLHSIAFLLKRQDRTISSAMCIQFIPKPIIKVVYKSFAGTEVTRSMSFIEAVCWVKEQGLLNVVDLKKARERAGSSFRGTMAQHFVLMED